ncbi:MAG: TlpA family protein disulfide reductase [Gammaproteobacteria bacterium]|nr:TlpA family protein disulfide reductase [Gammaproteobacteria bacterium]
MKKIIIALIIIAAAAAGFYFQQNQSKPPLNSAAKTSAKASSAISVIGQLRPEFILPDLEDKPRNISEWDGKIRLVNFWATWCPPCLREMPAFIAMQEEYADKNFVVLGIAIDRKDTVQDFVDSMGVNYPILYGEMAALDLTTVYGNRLGVLPFSVFVGADNKIISIHNGEITAETIKSILSSQNIK